MGCKAKTLHFFFSPVQTDLPRELVKLLTHAAQPGLVSPGCVEQAQLHYPASLSSESGEILRHVGCSVSWVELCLSRTGKGSSGQRKKGVV